jgi:DNA replication factor GINS
MNETLADKINRLLEDESKSKDILKINPETYHEIAVHIKSIRSESSEKERSLVSELSLAEREILYNITRRLMELRISKFTRNADSETTNLTPEEQFLVEPLIQSKKRLERIAHAIFNGQVAEIERAGESVKQKYVIARFVQPYAAISGTDLATYGPFEAEDVAILPIENAKSLAKIGIIMKSWVEPEE